MSTPHISVCICTFKRPDLLRHCLKSVIAQESGGRFAFSVVVVDNDREESAKAAVAEIGGRAVVAVKYCAEPRQNIARARNQAVRNASGNYIAFLDDDEFVSDNWLATLFDTLGKLGADGVLGPVNPHFEDSAPRWVIKGKFYERPVHPTGMVLSWAQCRTGNVLLKKELFCEDEPFKPECLSGEDQDFFRRKIAAGHKFVWCHEAAAFESVPPVRWKRGFLVRRALFRGIFAQRNHGLQLLRVGQAIVSVPVYLIALPFASLLGQATFMKCVFKLSYHSGRLLALAGFNPIQQPYVTE
jgi:succinoglycan biosynthesis protein ExoM